MADTQAQMYTRSEWRQCCKSGCHARHCTVHACKHALALMTATTARGGLFLDAEPERQKNACVGGPHTQIICFQSAPRVEQATTRVQRPPACSSWSSVHCNSFVPLARSSFFLSRRIHNAHRIRHQVSAHFVLTHSHACLTCQWLFSGHHTQ